MRDIHCPKDIGFENTFSGEDCEKEQHYNNCYHCWSTALAKEKAQQTIKVGYETGYERGIHDAWECARKIDTNRDLENYVFGDDLDNGYRNLSASEAMAKVKEYEEKQRQNES